jgi:ElaB/YqjD/DUF883 family membrane-anchored ribosome-binding protein
MADQFAHASEEARQARDAVNSATDHGQRALSEAIGAAERFLTDILDGLRTQTASYTEEAMHHLEDGQHYVTDQVKQRPMTFTLAGLGVGLLLGLVIAGRSK